MGFARFAAATSRYYITTPVFYVNSSPHIGHVHTLLVADALNRFQRLKLATNETILSTGTDEHGIKIQTAAAAKNIDCGEFCDLNANKFINLFKQYDTTLTDFIRTSEDRHKRAVEFVWSELQSKGLIYKSTYSGWYCNSDEVFVPETQVTKETVNGKDVFINEDKNEVIWSEEENYLFRLSQFIGVVEKWLVDEKPITPSKFNDEALRMIKTPGLGDISISRPKKRLKWGINVPEDPNQTIYVWLDALTNYLTVAGYPDRQNQDLIRWPIDCQLIGKDIIKFHAIYWPAFLSALSLPLPRKLICHSHWLLDSTKMSKSKGNVVDPIKENELFSAEGLRYYLLRSSTPHSDTDYSQTQAYRRINSELADCFGNLLSRCCATAINPDQIIPTRYYDIEGSSMFAEIVENLKHLPNKCAEHYESANFYKGVDEIMAVLRLNQQFYELSKPWQLVKEIKSSDESLKKYVNLQCLTFESLRISSILLQPIIPGLSNKALSRMNVDGRLWRDSTMNITTGDPSIAQRRVNNDQNSILFRRLKLDL